VKQKLLTIFPSADYLECTEFTFAVVAVIEGPYPECGDDSSELVIPLNALSVGKIQALVLAWLPGTREFFSRRLPLISICDVCGCSNAKPNTFHKVPFFLHLTSLRWNVRKVTEIRPLG